MSDRAALERLLLAHLDVLARMCAAQCRRHGVAGADAEDFAAWVRLRCVEDDYRILAQYRGEAALPTYLHIVVAMLYRDWRVQRQGRWRPSAAALHLGPTAVKLERLLHRERLPFEQAVRVIQMQEDPAPTLRELRELFRALPGRRPLRPEEVGDAALDDRPASQTADASVLAAEEDAARALVASALREALAALAPEDRAIVRLRFWEGASVADIARALNLPQKPLYRRLDRLLADVRRALERRGISRANGNGVPPDGERAPARDAAGGTPAPGSWPALGGMRSPAWDEHAARPSHHETLGGREAP